jgi:hypothetical protein
MTRTKYKRKPAEKNRDRVRVSELYLAGKYQYEIAALLHLSQPTVCRIIKELTADFHNTAMGNFEIDIPEEIARLENIYSQADRDYEASKRTSIIKTKRATMVSGSIVSQEITEREEVIMGDPKLLSLKLETRKEINRLKGLYKDKKSIDVTTGGDKLLNVNVVWDDSGTDGNE